MKRDYDVSLIAVEIVLSSSTGRTRAATVQHIIHPKAYVKCYREDKHNQACIYPENSKTYRS